MEKTRRWVRPVMLSVGCALLAVAVALTVLLFPSAVPPSSGSVTPPPPTTTATTVPPLPDNPVDFPTLQEANPHTVGWITLPGTVIDYPLMRSGEDVAEDYYLHHDVDRSYLFAGSIYMQRVNSPNLSDAVTVLYGHNMKNGSKFAALHKFKEADFFDEHRELTVCVPGHIYTYEIYSVFVYDDRLIPAAFDFTEPADLESYQKLTLAPPSHTKQVRQGVTLTPEDKILTLSTCTNRDTERLLLHAVLRQDTPTK